MNATPYLQVQDPKRMAGKGAPRSTIFGAIGRTKIDPYQRSLGGLIIETTKGKLDTPVISEASAMRAYHNTDRHILGKSSKTHIAGSHYGQVPYAGQFMSKAGARLS